MSVHIKLREWQRRGPGDSTDGLALRGLRLESSEARMLAAQLAKERVLEVVELFDGLSIGTFSYVGRIRLGDLTITVEPKLGRDELLELFRYAYGLRNLRLLERSSFSAGGDLFQDLIVAQLHAEARELLDRGLVRRYLERREVLASPRGRIDIPRVARMGGVTSAALPCRYHPRSSNHLLNQLVLSGLHLARRLVQDRNLRVDVSRLAAAYSEFAAELTLSQDTLASGQRALDRQVVAYEPALRLVELLYNSSSVSFDEDGAPMSLPGFLFDMNRFFQSLMARFLREHLSGFEFDEERALTEIMRYLPKHNPTGRRSPRPRPDFVVMRKHVVQALLDAKYRDLWERALPREMLYQLAVYALSQPKGATAAILYPTMSIGARESIIEIREPLRGGTLGYVAMRPVVLPKLATLIRERDAACAGLARSLALGVEQASSPAVA